MVKRDTQTIALQPTHRLASIYKEYHARTQKGKLIAWIIEDKLAKYLILSQKLAPVVDFLNREVLVDRACDKVSASAFYQISSCDRGDTSLTGGWSKHRWKVQPYALHDATGKFNSMRDAFEHRLIIGAPRCYRVSCSA